MTESIFQFCRVEAPNCIWSDLTDFMKELQLSRCTSKVDISFSGAENPDHPVPFLRINDQKVPRYYMAAYLGSKPHADWNKFRTMVRKYRMYWQFAVIYVYQNGIQIAKCSDACGFFSDYYDNYFRQLPPEANNSPFATGTSSSSSSNTNN